MLASISRHLCLLMYNIVMNNQQIAQLEMVKPKVRRLLGGGVSGHADDHVKRLNGQQPQRLAGQNVSDVLEKAGK